MVTLGSFATAEEAALCVARLPEGQAAARKTATAAPQLTSEEARQQAQAEGLTLRVANNKAGCFGVNHQPNRSNPYQALLRRGGKTCTWAASPPLRRRRCASRDRRRGRQRRKGLQRHHRLPRR